MRRVVCEFIAADADYISLAQSPTEDVGLTINGVGKNQFGAFVKMPGNFGYVVTLTSAADDLSGIDFLITGKDNFGNTLTATLAGPSSNTVATTAVFFDVESIVPDGTDAGTVSAGIGTTGYSKWIPCNDYQTPVNIGIGVDVAATINWGVQQTYENVFETEPAAGAIFACEDTGLVGQTGDKQGKIITPIGAHRFIVNSSSGTPALRANSWQAGT